MIGSILQWSCHMSNWTPLLPANHCGIFQDANWPFSPPVHGVQLPTLDQRGASANAYIVFGGGPLSGALMVQTWTLL
eukprot:5029312-Karenia_brevis.AAC.1